MPTHTPGAIVANMAAVPHLIEHTERAAFDLAYLGDTGQLPPLPEISDAWVLPSAPTLGEPGEVDAAVYISVRHVVTPYVLRDGAPAGALQRVLAAITDSLRSQVRDSLIATEGDTPAQMSYDVYVEAGSPPLGDEYEQLPVTVWRRRVC